LKKTQKISINSDDEILILGIVAYEKIHKVSWALNETLDINLKINENETSETFECFEEHNFKLISNKVNTNFFVKEIKNIDFIFKIIGENLSSEKIEIIKKLKSINFIIAVFEIDIEKYKKSKKMFLEF